MARGRGASRAGVQSRGSRVARGACRWAPFSRAGPLPVGVRRCRRLRALNAAARACGKVRNGQVCVAREPAAVHVRVAPSQGCQGHSDEPHVSRACRDWRRRHAARARVAGSCRGECLACDASRPRGRAAGSGGGRPRLRSLSVSGPGPWASHGRMIAAATRPVHVTGSHDSAQFIQNTLNNLEH